MVTVSTGGEISSLANAFTITGSTPGLLTVTPSSGQQGQSLNVVITGNAYTNFVSGQVSGGLRRQYYVADGERDSPNQVSIPITITTVPMLEHYGAPAERPGRQRDDLPVHLYGYASSASIISVSPTCVRRAARRRSHRRD